MTTNNSQPQFDQVAAARAYTNLGFKITPIPYGGKGPAVANWNAVENLIGDDERAARVFAGRPQNMGIQHQASGTCAIDVDDVETTRMIFDHFGLDYEGMVRKGMRIYSKPNRDKLLFVAPAGLDLEQIRWPKEVQTKPNDVFTIFEMRAGPNQDVLPPSRHPDGHFYVWMDGRAPWDFGGAIHDLPQLPRDVLEFWKAYADPATGIKDAVHDLCPWKKEKSTARVVVKTRSSSGANNNIIGKFNEANSVDEMLQNNGYKKRGKRYLAPSSSTVIPGVVILEGGKCYSHHGSDVLADGYAHDAFDLLVLLEHNGQFDAALADAARQLGIDRNAPVVPVSSSEIDGLLAAAAAKRGGAPQPVPAEVTIVAPEEDGEEEVRDALVDPAYPEHLRAPPGMVGRITEWINETSRSPLPLLAVGAALTTVGTALARRVSEEGGLRTNFYVIGLARSGYGKDHARRCVKKLIDATNTAEDMMGGEEIASGAGLKGAIQKRPGGVFLIDEFGDLLSAINNKNAGPHLAGIATQLVKAFTSTQGIWYGTEYADQKLRPRVDIPFPCASLYGTTVPSNFYSNLDSSAVAGGFLGRMIILEESSKRPPRRPDRFLGDVPEDIAQWFVSASQIIPPNDPSWANGRPGEYPLPVPYTPAARRIMDEFELWCCRRSDEYLGTPREPLAELWSRAPEHAAKVALAVGVGMTMDPDALLEARNTRCLSIDQTAAQWAVDFSKAVAMHIELAASTRMGDSDHERLAQRVLESVRKAGARGRTERELAKFCRPYAAAQPALRDQITSMLTRNGDIKAGQRASPNGKSSSVWLAGKGQQ